MRWRCVLVSLLLLFAASVARADQFVAGTEDIPLMPGLNPVRGSSLVFDKPEGRIVEAEAQGAVSRGKVLAFYVATLPQLGWRKIGGSRWQRDAEHLTLDFHGRNGHLTVGFTISP